MPIGIFVIIHGEITGPVLSAGYYRRKVEISKELISKMYLSHAGFEANGVIELALPDYKILSCYTGDQARTSGKEGILALILETKEPSNNLELFLRQNIEQCIAVQSDSLLKKMLDVKLAQYCQLLTIFERTSIEYLDFFAVIQTSKESQQVLVKFGSEAISNENLFHHFKPDNQISGDGYFLAPIGTVADTDYLVIVHSNSGKTADIQPLVEQIASILKNNINYAWEIIAMVFFPQFITFQSLELLEILHLYNSHKSLSANLAKAKGKDYRIEFASLLSAVLKGLIYPINVP
jgi:hypothetical protein